MWNQYLFGKGVVLLVQIGLQLSVEPTQLSHLLDQLFNWLLQVLVQFVPVLFLVEVQILAVHPLEHENQVSYYLLLRHQALSVPFASYFREHLSTRPHFR